MKDPVQKKEATTQTGENEQEKLGAGASMAPPAFALSNTPVQKKDDPAPAAKKPLNKQEAFVKKFAASAIALENKDGIPALFTLAQGALESGWGEKAIGNALFGIKADKNWKGKKQLVVTTEYFKTDTHRDDFPEVLSVTQTESGKYKYVVKDWFRDYDTVEEGLEDHSRFLIVNKRYAGAFNTTTPQDFARAVADAGYATAGNYADTLIAVMNSVKKYWPAEAGPIPTGNSKAITGGKPGGAAPQPDPKKPAAEQNPTSGTPTTKPTTGTTNPSAGDGKSIKASVGEGGVNAPADALVVKGLLIKAGYALSGTADVGPKTIGFIKDFQSKAMGWKNPDGLVEPGGATFKALLNGAGVKPETKPASKPSSAPVPSSLNFDSMSERLNQAMFGGYFGMGTDEEAIFATLNLLGRDGDKIQGLKSAYTRKYRRDLVADLRDELSDSILGNDLQKALELLTPKPSAQPKPVSTPSAGTTTSKPATTTPSTPTTSSPTTSGKSGTNQTTTGNQAAGSTGAKLDQFYNDFSHIKVVVGDKTVEVTPPYHINKGPRLEKALAARAADPKVMEMVNALVKQGKIRTGSHQGKSSPADIKAILEEAIARGLVQHNSGDMHAFLAKYGLSVDCSGYVTQALNFLMDGNMTVDSKDKLNPGMFGSGSLKGGEANFTKVNLSDIQAGDTMHVEGHIRIINQVSNEGGVLFFRTAESTASKNAVTGNNGLTTRWWKYEGGKTYYSWTSYNGPHPAATDKVWTQSKESNTYGRYKQLEK